VSQNGHGGWRADTESVLIFVGPPEGYLDDALQVGQRAAGRQHHPAPDLRTDTSQRNVKPIYDLSFHKRGARTFAARSSGCNNSAP
jgi:hypothetical protein